VLKQWKTDHEGAENSVLNRLAVLDTDGLMKTLAELATPPLDRLEHITKLLEGTGTASAETVAELKRIIAVMSATDGGVDARTAQALAFSAEIFGTNSFERNATVLANAADVLSGVLTRMEDALGRMSQYS
jgi:hypothetical protein